MPPSTQQLTALDEAFLANERGGAHLHVGAVLLCEGPAPEQDALLAHVASRLDRVPRYRQRLVRAPFAMGRAAWVDDPSFDLEYHLRRTALPAPGGAAELRRLAERIFSQRLDRTKPLWELFVVEGLEDGGFALINKTHHAVVDGVSGMDVTTALFDLDGDVRSNGREPRTWSPAPPPSTAALAVQAVEQSLARPVRYARQSLRALQTPERAAGQVRDGVSGVLEVGAAMLGGQPRPVVNGAPTSHRRLRWFARPLSDYRTIKKELGGTVNDVLLASMAGGLRGWMEATDQPLPRSPLRVMVPVSVRTDAERGALGNRIAGMSAALPVHLDDPVDRLRAVSEQLEHLKRGRQAVGAQVVAGLQELAPPTILAQASRLQFSSRLYNLLISNVPGPQVPVYVLGRRLTSFVPIAFLGPDKRLAVVAASYDGTLTTSFLSCRELPLVELLAEATEEAVDDLLALAGGS